MWWGSLFEFCMNIFFLKIYSYWKICFRCGEAIFRHFFMNIFFIKIIIFRNPSRDALYLDIATVGGIYNSHKYVCLHSISGSSILESTSTIKLVQNWTSSTSGGALGDFFWKMQFVEYIKSKYILNYLIFTQFWLYNRTPLLLLV